MNSSSHCARPKTPPWCPVDAWSATERFSYAITHVFKGRVRARSRHGLHRALHLPLCFAGLQLLWKVCAHAYSAQDAHRTLHGRGSHLTVITDAAGLLSLPVRSSSARSVSNPRLLTLPKRRLSAQPGACAPPSTKSDSPRLLPHQARARLHPPRRCHLLRRPALTPVPC
jgi:hypothetical protein